MSPGIIPTFAEWTDRLKEYNDYIKALGEYKKASAEAELKLAEAAAQWEKVRAMRLVINQMALDLKRLNQQIHRNKQEMARIDTRAKSASVLLNGRPIAAFARAWAAYTWFERQAMVEASHLLYAVPVPDDAHEATNFVDNRNPDATCQPLPASATTAPQLASFLFENKYMARKGPAHATLAALFGAINSVAAATVADLEKAIEDMRKGTYDAWKPDQIIGVPAGVRVVKIEHAAMSRSPNMRLGPLPTRALPRNWKRRT
jgi:hypothetical protein